MSGAAKSFWRDIMQVKDIMSEKVVSVSPEENLSVAARLLSRYNIGALPVCTKDGKLKGMVTDRDIVLRCVAAEDDANSVKVADIMTRRVVCVDASQSIRDASDLMAQKQVRRLPVQDQGRLVGMISIGDLAKVPNFSVEAAAALSDIASNVRHFT